MNFTDFIIADDIYYMRIFSKLSQVTLRQLLSKFLEYSGEKSLNEVLCFWKVNKLFFFLT